MGIIGCSARDNILKWIVQGLLNTHTIKHLMVSKTTQTALLYSKEHLFTVLPIVLKTEQAVCDCILRGPPRKGLAATESLRLIHLMMMSSKTVRLYEPIKSLDKVSDIQKIVNELIHLFQIISRINKSNPIHS